MKAEKLRVLAESDVSEPLPSDQLMAALQAPPFVYVPGTFNTRDLGLVPTASGTAPAIRPGFAYRSGALTGLQPDGKAVLAGKLGVKKVFDLRSIDEHKNQPDPEIEGIENVWKTSAELEAVVDLADFVDGEGEKGYEKMYLEVLRDYQDNFRSVLEHVRDQPEEPFLFHCTAGRDRTGVMAGLLATLAGASLEDVTLDFLLSRVGTEPAREQLLAFALRGTGAASKEAPGFYNLVSLKPMYWAAFAAAVDAQHGGFDGYVTQRLGFSDADLATIKKNLKP
ncbi:hypothetical protein GQ53DRAFT_745404 [Thozetella sp. PMI_491]|nr:hypothetical protein GQ53DRAFT_745404 [Thozetella sp. PMI_491]